MPASKPMIGSRDVFISAYAVDDSLQNPDYAHIKADEALLHKLERLQALCKTEGLTEVRVLDFPAWGPAQRVKDYRLSGLGELVVSRCSFYFCDLPRYGSGEIQSRGQNIDEFCSQVRAVAPMDTLLLADVENPVESLLEELGYELSEDSARPGLWVWTAPTDACDSSYESRGAAVAGAWKDACEQTRNINSISDSAWQDLNIADQIEAVESALSANPVRERE